MPRITTGIGFDTHRFAEGRLLVLGGIRIEGAMGLDGHSDADVLTHAVMDALLGAIADGDIGQHFPDTDARWKGADSIVLLEHVMSRLVSRGARPVHVDVTVLAETPKLAPHRDRMRARLAAAMGLDMGSVSIKATTLEQMGALGRREGIAVMAVATVEQRERAE